MAWDHRGGVRRTANGPDARRVRLGLRGFPDVYDEARSNAVGESSLLRPCDDIQGPLNLGPLWYPIPTPNSPTTAAR
jgi:hypothetical protein